MARWFARERFVIPDIEPVSVEAANEKTITCQRIRERGFFGQRPEIVPGLGGYDVPAKWSYKHLFDAGWYPE